MYIPREIESTLKKMLKQYKVVLVTGARQVGKTTMLKKCLTDSFNYVTLEDPVVYSVAENDAVLFFQNNAKPLIIDEVQRVPKLFQTTKFIVDESQEYGQIVLTGSQTYHLMKGVSESLAGRICILEMSGISLRELNEKWLRPEPYVPSLLKEGDISFSNNFDLWTHIHTGSMPRLCERNIDWNQFWSSYIQTYIQRDVHDLINVKSEAKFFDFIVACAARTGQLLNATDIANAIDVSYKTVQSWLSILEASGTIRLIKPFWPNIGKSVTKTPKLYFMDTGLVCYLGRWTTPDQLKNGAIAGHVFETFVVSEVLKSYMSAGANIRDVWFYRDSKKREIDLIIQEGHILHPVEIKLNATINLKDISNFKYLESFADYEIGFGHVICQTNKPYLLTKDVQAVPVWAI